jgi:hypothetical protein
VSVWERYLRQVEHTEQVPPLLVRLEHGVGHTGDVGRHVEEAQVRQARVPENTFTHADTHTYRITTVRIPLECTHEPSMEGVQYSPLL